MEKLGSAPVQRYTDAQVVAFLSLGLSEDLQGSSKNQSEPAVKFTDAQMRAFFGNGLSGTDEEQP